MHKLILIVTVVLGCSFSALAQSEQTKTAEHAPVAGKDEEGKVLTSVEQMPEFPGGVQGIIRFLSTNVKYPELALKLKVEGRVLVKFVVSNSGKVKNVVLLRDIGYGCGEEALRVVRSMPDWKPGKQNGQYVNVYFTLPISFRLRDPEPPTQGQTRFR
jgi:TonB family protein